jgi:trans-aconitate 2-methyltransferase
VGASGSPTWDPASYARFGDERSRPFVDLMARVGARHPRHVVDLGCGSGALTATLKERWPAAQVHGVDSSAEMVAAAADLDTDVVFTQGDVRSWRPALSDAPVDVIVSNAVLQWVPEHRDLLPRWTSCLASGGWLAVQVPGNFEAPSHALMREVADRPAFRVALAGVLRGGDSVDDPAGYADRLAAAGCRVDAWETTYLHVLDPAGEHGDDAVLAWVSGTGLRPVLDALAGDDELQEEFVQQYRDELRGAYPRRHWGTPLPFRRVFVVAQRP